ncbi:ABC transporter permease [Telmatospirillum siberiense]|uniref:ABC transmembrane type-1 domain-containing protein n=1 Tax=Telmatospirillum siberiense TaxID=382514 RepID=A0A2N3PPV1_9PROT|nr:ABC transporter permease [Telmatospirillum siberiense]PKU22424.1 hypothetical protein CWS72_21730 [Telmatospirillum siberiense]
MSSRISNVALPGSVFLLLTLAFELAGLAGLLPPTIPRPVKVVENMVGDGAVLWLHCRSTVLTAACGYAMAIGAAFSAGFLVHQHKALETAALTIGTVLNSIPIIAVAPILIIWMGVSWPMRITLTAFLCFFPIFVGMIQGLGATERNAGELFLVLAATPAQRFWKLALPSALPYIFLGLKIAAPLAVLGALVAEWTGTETGLGVLMINAMFNFQMERLWASVLIVCILSAGSYGALSLIERVVLTADRTADGIAP